MVFNKRYIGLLIATISFVFCNQVQLITMHKKSNGTLLRIVSSSIIDIENIAGWSGQENWFYITVNGTYLSPSAVEYIEFEPPIVDIEINKPPQKSILLFSPQLFTRQSDIFCMYKPII